MESLDVAIIGAGPAGLAAARKLVDGGVTNVAVFEREPEAGGVPRHCGHLGFGWQAFHRFWSGPRFAAELRRSTKDLDVRLSSTVLSISPDGRLEIHRPTGISTLWARRILIATGARETPRAARFAPGTRPPGVMNTGALQQMVYLHKLKPFSHPVIIGTEWVSFSALLTCRHLGIRPAAMIEENAATTAPGAGRIFSRLVFGVPVMTGTKLIAVEGTRRVEAVEVEREGKRQRIACDGVVFTGRFRPENTLFARGELALVPETGSPHLSEGLRTDNPVFYAAGNVLMPLKSSGACWQQGVAAAEALIQDIS